MVKKVILFLFIFALSNAVKGQVSNFIEKFELPNNLNESSGLLFLNDKILTHNDSGDSPNLYELDKNSGTILRTISITNATHIDWEDITQDETYIYIGDFGNNNGNRTNLKVYKISKTDYLNNTYITAEEIEFNYEDQTDFTSRPNNNNFDAEALIEYRGTLYIFSKNWENSQTKVYKLPTIAGTHTAVKVSEANVEGLITGATTVNDHIVLCGSDTVGPFIVFISGNRSPGDDIFSSGFEKSTLNENLEVTSQVEAIAATNDGEFYLSREQNNAFGNALSAKVYEFKDNRSLVLNTNDYKLNSFEVYPNPTRNVININTPDSIKEIAIYNVLGKKIVSTSTFKKRLDVSFLAKGIYLLKVTFSDNKEKTKKIIKL